MRKKLKRQRTRHQKNATNLKEWFYKSTPHLFMLLSNVYVFINLSGTCTRMCLLYVFSFCVTAQVEGRNQSFPRQNVNINM